MLLHTLFLFILFAASSYYKHNNVDFICQLWLYIHPNVQMLSEKVVEIWDFSSSLQQLIEHHSAMLLRIQLSFLSNSKACCSAGLQ